MRQLLLPIIIVLLVSGCLAVSPETIIASSPADNEENIVENQITQNYDSEGELEIEDDSSKSNLVTSSVCETDGDCGELKTCPDGSNYYEFRCVEGECEPLAFTGGPCFEPGVMPDDDECPEGTLLHEEICKPKIFNLMVPTESDYFLDETLTISIIYNWKESQSLVQKAAELTSGLDNNLDKVKAIANWVKTSKNYNIDREFIDPSSVEEIFNSPEGMCNEAALISVGMLRSIGIESIPVGAPAHVFTAFRLDGSGRWNSFDSTFCPDKTDCSNVTIDINPLIGYDEWENEVELNTIYQTSDARSQHLDEDSGKYCDNFGFCLDSTFISRKAILGQEDTLTGTVFYPSVVRLESAVLDGRGQTKCAFVPHVICDSIYGCRKKGFAANNMDIFPVNFQVGEKSIGYNKLELPENNYTYMCIDVLYEKTIVFTEFHLAAGDIIKITHNDIIRGENASEEEFQFVKNKIKELTENLGIEP